MLKKQLKTKTPNRKTKMVGTRSGNESTADVLYLHVCRNKSLNQSNMAASIGTLRKGIKISAPDLTTMEKYCRTVSIFIDLKMKVRYIRYKC